MDLGLKGKVVLVTAASKGLGRASAMEFAREGARLLIASRNNEELQKTAEEIRQATGSEVHTCATDVSKREDIERLYAVLQETYGTLDVLVTNAGGPPTGKFDDFDDAAWEAAFQLNLMSVIRLIRGALPYMRQNGGGRIVNVASTSIKEPIVGLLLSNTIRSGAQALVKTLSQELAGDNILVNTVSPGRIATDRIIQLDNQRAEAMGTTADAVQKHFEATIPLGRYGQPEEFGKMVAFLGSGANTYVTGQSLFVDGGMLKSI
ncbi:MAG: SDR family oxidoreductase [Tumebacillaceae bacterium]